MNEVSISSARASVVVYDDINKRWVPSGSSSGLSKVQLYHHLVHNTFRVVGRKLQDHEIVINCAILKGLKYNQATVTFHQWRDNNQVYGLNFSSKDDAETFARAMLQALDMLSNGSNISRSLVPTGSPAGQQQQQQQQQQQPPLQQQQPLVYSQQPQQSQQPPSQGTTQYEEDMGYSENEGHAVTRVSLSLGQLFAGGPAVSSSVPPTPTLNQNNHNYPFINCAVNSAITRTMTKEDVAIIQERRMSQQSQGSNGANAVSPSYSATNQQQQQQQQGHHRTSSAPPAPQPQPPPMPGNPLIRPQQTGPPVAPPPPTAVANAVATTSSVPPPPVAPPAPPSMTNYNAPVPPPMINPYSQSPSQTNITNQSAQSQAIYSTQQINQYATNQNQYTGGSQTNLYPGNTNGTAGNNNNSNNNTNSSNSNNNNNNQNYQNPQGNGVGNGVVGVSGGNQYSSQTTYSGNNQYGSNNSINQYPNSPSPYAQGQQTYSTTTTNQVQYGQNCNNNNNNNPYGTPVNNVNQYSSSGTISTITNNTNAYASTGSIGGPPPPPMGPLNGQINVASSVNTNNAAPPPPPPPPVPNSNTNGCTSNNEQPEINANSLAAALQAARLKKKQQQSQSVENSGSSTSSSGSGAGNYGTIGRGAGGSSGGNSGNGGSSGGGGGMASMMDEMAKTLARRRAACEKKQPEQPPEPDNSPDKKSGDKNGGNKFSNGNESPKSARKRFGSASEDTILKVNGVNESGYITSQEMDAFKAEIIKEVRKEFQKMKTEIVEALKGELSRR